MLSLDSKELSEWSAFYQIEKEDMERAKKGQVAGQNNIESSIKMGMTGYRKGR